MPSIDALRAHIGRKIRVAMFSSTGRGMVTKECTLLGFEEIPGTDNFYLTTKGLRGPHRSLHIGFPELCK
jgi:hypothetical protein